MIYVGKLASIFLFIALSTIIVDAQNAPTFLQEEDDNSFTLFREDNSNSDFTFLAIPSKDEIELIKKNNEIVEIQSEIQKRAGDITSLEKEIDELNQGLTKIYNQKNTLNRELNKNTLENRRNEANINLTEERIERGKLEVKGLTSEIKENSENLIHIQDVIVNNFRKTNEIELGGVRSSFILEQDFFKAFGRLEETYRLSNELQEHLNLVEEEIIDLRKSQRKVSNERERLEEQQVELTARKEIYGQTIKQQERLLLDTKSSEKQYQELLEEKEKLRVSLLQDIAIYESQIQFIHDPTSIPKSGTKLLRKPFEIKARLTQGFGRTPFAIKNAARYGGVAFHTGVDFGMPTGTKLISPADGKVVSVGDTDVVRTCVLWGKWMLIEHEFGLTTLYAHMSHISVSVGQTVKEGELIGYSGNTGFSTGPHLHFAVYASGGINTVPYETISSSYRCRGVNVPVAARDAKLNPLNYLIL